MVDICKAADMQHVVRHPHKCCGVFAGGQSPPSVRMLASWKVSKQSGFKSPTATTRFRGSSLNDVRKLGPQQIALDKFQPNVLKTVICATISVPTDDQSEPAAPELVSQLLELVAQSDRGADIEESRKKAVFKCVEELESLGMAEPLKSHLIFGEWEVSYTSSPTAAGGYYRSLLGRALLKTTELVQTIQEPDVVGNRVLFQLVGLVPGKVSLEGRLQALDEKWVEVTFVAPRFELGSLKFAYGGESKVKLQTTYLDETIRIGRGGRGSIFVFKRL